MIGTLFGIPGVMADPRLELFDNGSGQKIGENDDWGAETSLSGVGAMIGAFSLGTVATKDAMLLVTLPPGAYSARLSGVGSSGGTAIVEVYEVR